MKILKPCNEKHVFITLSQSEAIRLILSLSSQIVHNNCNRGRVEFMTRTKYFSISVDEENNPTANTQKKIWSRVDKTKREKGKTK